MPYGRCKLNGGGWREIAAGVAEGIGGIIGDNVEDGAAINEEGFTRLVTRLLLLIESEESLRVTELRDDGTG